VTGKSGTSTVLQTFGGGSVATGECARFDSNGNIIGSGWPCPVSGQTNFSQSFISQSSVTLNHGLNTANVIVSCYDSANQMVGANSVTVVDTNRAAVSFATPQTGRCVVNGTGGGGITTGEESVAANSGTGAAVLKTGTNVTARTLKAGTNVVISAAADEITISATGASGGITSINSQTAASQALSAGSFVNIASSSNIHTISVTGTQGSGTRLATVNASPSDGCAGWSGGTLMSLGAPCGSGGGSAYMAGAGISIADGAISVDAATVPTFLSGVAPLSDWSGGADTVAPQACAEKAFTLGGAAMGDAVAPGWPATLPANLTGTMYVAASSSIVVRLCNPTADAIAVSDGLNYRATIIKTF
jgi:hypothetical protein